MMLPEMIYRGSVKNVRGPTADEALIFEYSDRYSVFDWGEMPDHLPGKGEALAVTAQSCFEFLGVPHHSLGLVDENLKVLGESQKSRLLKVKKVEVQRPIHRGGSWDYSGYRNRKIDQLIPLEVIFRFGLPKGSSLIPRLQKDPAYQQSLGLKALPTYGDQFDVPLIEFSTKLEPSDRYIKPETAKEIAGFSDAEFSEFQKSVRILSQKLKNLFVQCDLELWDGKFEFAFVKNSGVERSFMLVDSIGPDELRLTHGGIQISKEIMRQFYTGSAWYRAVQAAKETALKRSTSNWKQICVEELGEKPNPLSSKVKNIVQKIYPSVADSLRRACGKKPLFDAPKIPDLVKELKTLDEMVKA